MPEQLRFTFAVDESLKKLVDESLWVAGNVSDYMRGVIVFHQLLMGNSPRGADVPGWVFNIFPIALIGDLRKQIQAYWEEHQMIDPATGEYDYAAYEIPKQHTTKKKPEQGTTRKTGKGNKPA